MKNLSAILRLSLPETFTILITLVVCLAGFTEAEVQTNYRKQQEENYNLKEALFKRGVPYAHQTSKMTENESEDRNLVNFKNIQQIPLEKLIKRHSDDFGESDDSDEKDSDGYGYDDDEYYHFNFKRNDETLESNKMEKEGVRGSNEKEGISGQKTTYMNQNGKEKAKEIETIEMLNYKESHPTIDQNGNPTPMESPKPYSEELNRKKVPSNSNILSSLKMSDLRGTSAIDEKMKDRKDESGLSSGSSAETKTSDAKKSVKVAEDKDAVKLKDSKLAEEADHKEKEASLKDAKEAVVGKAIKESPKSSEEKDKAVKLSDSAKLEENVEKISGKTKESESPKLTREDTADGTRFADKISSDMINPSGLNQINNRASFVSSDYKDNADAMKSAGMEEDEKTLEETCGMETNVGLSDYQDELRRSRENLRKLYSQRDVEGNQIYGSLNARENSARIFRDSSKPKEYAHLGLGLQNVNTNDLFKKEMSDGSLDGMKFFTQPQRQLQEQQQQQQQQLMQMQQQLSQEMSRQSSSNSDSRYKNNYGFSFQPSELENTEYHKNYIKSLKRYKSLNGEQKGMLPEASNPIVSRTVPFDEVRNLKKKFQESVKRRSMESPTEQRDSLHPKLRRNARRDLLLTQSLRNSEALSKAGKDDAKVAEGKKLDEQKEASRSRRKSPLKLEYEIKVINQSPQDSKNNELSNMAQRRFEKDLKTKLATEEKYLKKYPVYSQVSREDLTRLVESEGEKKFKRKAPVWKRHDRKSGIQTRAVPSGYYGNRVKFGQKNYAKNNDRSNSDPSALDMSHVSASFLTSDTPASPSDKNKLQRSWEVRQQDYRHDPMKRYDESGYNNKGNSLLLVRKGQRTATAFEDASAHQNSESNLSADNLAKMLSKDTDYIVLKKTDKNKFQKISEMNPSDAVHLDADTNYSNKLSQEGNQRDSLKNSGRQTLKNKAMYARSFRQDKEDKKFSSASHSSKSNLKKTFDKFRDLAGFFKDNEQESTDNQYSAQELKEGRDIVFSEDKLPDPIVISNDPTGKSMAFNQKQQNSIYSISTNFKTLDQQDKKSEVPASSEADKNMFTAEAKSDNSESSWEPTLRNIFPEAKSINSMSKNGNEIIILDLNRNQLKTEHGFSAPSKSGSKQYGAFGLTSQIPGSNSAPSENTIQVMLSPVQNKFQPTNKVPQKSPYSNKARNNRAYAVVRTADNVSQVSFRNIADLPSLLKALSDKQSGTKLLAKRSSPRSADGQLSENYKRFLTELSELSELNKSSYRKGKFAKKRNVEEIALPSSSFPELSNYGDANIKYLGNLLHNIMTGENPEFKGMSGAQTESSDVGIPKELEGSLKSSSAARESNSKFQRRWSSTEEKHKYDMPLKDDKTGDGRLRSEKGASEDKSFQDELLAELAAASGKIGSLREEGAGMRKLRQTIQESLSLRGKQQSMSPSTSSELKSEDKCKRDSRSAGLISKDKTAFGSELKSDHATKESSDKSFLKSNYENHLSEFFENLNSNKDQKDQVNVPNESTWKRKKRKENHRRKRSASHDVKNKVSTTAVQNTILKNLAEDNYQSIYSPGIKRRLFSTNNEADDADNYSDAYERDKNVIVEEAQPKCVKNSLNKCIDPMIVELFGAVDKEEEKNRARRSLTSGFHSNFKREIDLDESMPNDFQNFLVTSLGGFGSQNREVIKKDVALWERKESTQDTNQIAESSSSGGKEDPNSTLEKREVPSSENRKGQTYFPMGASSDSNLGDMMVPLNHVEKKLRVDNKSKLKSKAEFAEEKLPTQIRIQITNASSKEKKSSKPIMDESETTATEMETLPKEKEFFDKNKINTLRLNNLPKLHSPSKNKFSFADYEDDTDNSLNNYRLHRRRRKKKKYVPENPAKPIKDFIKFDQKTMETFLKRILTDQNMASDQTTQKSPVSNHLPQVETVYNPTQGTNKAQLEVSRFGKINSANNKNTGTAKNNMQSTESIGYDEGILRNYLKDKTDKIKSDKSKEFEDIDWKPRYGKMRLRQELGWEPSNQFNMPALKTSLTDTPYTANTEAPPYMNPFSQHLYSQKNQVPTSNYFFHPSATNSDNSNSLYDALKLKQEMKNQNGLANDHSTTKMFKKPYYYNSGGFYKMDDKTRNQNSLFPGLSTGDGSWNYEYTLNKKPSPRGFKGRDFFTGGLKGQSHLDTKSKIAYGGNRKFMKTMDDEKSLVMDASQSSPLLENTKDADYLDSLGVDDDYLDDDSGKELQTEEQLLSAPMKYHRFFNSDADDNMNEDEEEIDEDYDENGEEDDPDDYSLLANTKAMNPQLTKNGHRKVKFQGSFNDDSVLSRINYLYPKDNLLQLRGHSFEQTEFTNSKNDMKFSQGRHPIGLSDIKNDVGSLSSTTGILKKANENANIFGKNLMKNTYGFSSENLPSQLPESKMKELNALYHHNKLFKRKMDSQTKLKRRRELPQIGSRLFYAAKTEISDSDSGPAMFLKQIQGKARNSRHASCRRNPFNAEFADPGNNFDESEENGNDKLLNFGKNLQDEDEEDKDADQDEDADFEDVSENLEDDGETISEDNVLENVIGKYIMRKRVASSDDLSKSESSQSEGTHKLEKRSLGESKYEKLNDVKIVKRLSSGHLTENNFRKFHKKNFTKKREVNEFDFDANGNAADGKAALIKTGKRENSGLKKRSALDLFKKITNKDRDNKKVENVDGRTAGFEPLSSLNDKKYESSIRDAKFELMNQVKKLSNESPQTQIKSSVIELKERRPSEGQLTADQRKKEKMRLILQDNPSILGQGPWRIELNDKYDIKLGEFSKNANNLKEVTVPASQDNENLKAFLVFSNSLRAFKRSTADLSPTSGSSQKEVGNSYRPKSDEGRRISKMHLSKRSLDSSVVTSNDKDAARDQFTSGKATETHVDIEEKNRALHDTMSLSEGDSKPQASHVLQRNTESFVNDDEQCPNSRLPPVGTTNNRMSVFPPSNDENIMRDNRQVNEETSKNLGQQIVDAILSHVSANPKFREMIAPGLTSRTTAYKEDIDTTKETFHQADASDQLQFFLQKFMFDLEKLAEKHVRKRMCTQIDKQSKEFLQSLLNVPGDAQADDDENCMVAEDYLELEKVEEQSTSAPTTEASSVTPSATPSLVPNSSGELDNLRKKHCLLLKLIDDYEKLTKLEKDSLRVHYQYLLEELEQTNKEMGSLTPIVDSEICSRKFHRFPSGKNRNNGFENAVVEKQNATCQCPNCTTCPQTKSPYPNWQYGGQAPVPPKSNPVDDEPAVKADLAKSKPIIFPSYSFEEDTGKGQQLEKITPAPIFEAVDSVNVTSSGQNNDKNLKNQKQNLKEPNLVHSSATPQTFDLLPLENSTQKIDSFTPGHSLGSSDSIRLQQSLSGTDNVENFDNPTDLEDPKRLTELHKLSLGDAAGLQLSLKYRGPWVSNLDVAKSIRNVPLPSAGTNEMNLVPKSNLEESLSAPRVYRAATDVPSIADVKNSKNSVASNNDYFSSYAKMLPARKGVAMAVFPYFNIQMIVPKYRPFETVNRNRAQDSYFLRKVSATGKKRVFLRSSDFPASSQDVPKIPDVFRLSKEYPQIVKLFPQNPHALPQSPYVVFQPPDVRPQAPNHVVQSENVLKPVQMLIQSPNSQAQAPDIPFQPSDVIMESPDVQAQSPGMSSQPSNVILELPNDQKQYPEISFQPSDIQMGPPNVETQSSDMSLEPLDIKIESATILKDSPDISFQPSDVIAEPPNVETQSSDTSFQPTNIRMESPNAQNESPEVPFQPFEIRLESANPQKQSPDVSFQPLDIRMEPPSAQKQSPDVSYQPLDIRMEPPSAQKQSPDVSFQPLDIRMEPPSAQKQTPDVSFQPLDIRMEPPSAQKQTPDVSFQPLDIRMEPPSAQKQTPDVSFQPLDIRMEPPSAQKQTPDVSFQPLDIRMEPPSAQKQSPDVSFQPLDIRMEPPSAQKQTPDVSFQPLDIRMEPPSAQKQSPDISFHPSDIRMEPPSVQKQSSLQSSDAKTPSPDVQMESPDISFHPSDIIIRPSKNPMQFPEVQMQSENSQTQSQDVPMKFQNFPMRFKNVQMQFQNVPTQASHDTVESAETPMQPSWTESPVARMQSPEPFKQSSPESGSTVPHLPTLPSQPPEVFDENIPTPSPGELLGFPRQRKPSMANEFYKKHCHHKKNRLFSHFPLPTERKHKHKHKNKSKKSLSSKNSEETEEDDKNYEAEYLAWSKMPAVRRQLNKLEAGLELDDFFIKNPSMRKTPKGGEDNPV